MARKTSELFRFETVVRANGSDYMDKLNGLIEKYKARERYDYIQADLTVDILEIFPLPKRAINAPHIPKGIKSVSGEAFTECMLEYVIDSIDNAVFKFAYEYVVSRVFEYWNDFNNHLNDYNPAE